MVGRIRVIFRTKGGHKEGMGDVISSLCIAKEFRKRGCICHFLINDNKNVKNLISKSGFTFTENRENVTNYLRNRKFEISVLNQLNSPKRETFVFRRKSDVLASIEDKGESAKLVDLRFNVLYPIRNSFTDFKYIPLAENYSRKHSHKRIIKKEVKNILVTQGGSDTYGFTPKILKGLYYILPEIKISVVLGPNFRHFKQLCKVLAASPRKFDLVTGTDDLSDLMLKSDLAISAGGNTLFELSCLGVPTIVVCQENFEIATATRLEKQGCCLNLGLGRNISEKAIRLKTDSLINNFSLRRSLSIKGRSVVDGKGAERIVDTILNYFLLS